MAPLCEGGQNFDTNTDHSFGKLRNQQVSQQAGRFPHDFCAEVGLMPGCQGTTCSLQLLFAAHANVFMSPHPAEQLALSTAAASPGHVSARAPLPGSSKYQPSINHARLTKVFLEDVSATLWAMRTLADAESHMKLSIRMSQRSAKPEGSCIDQCEVTARCRLSLSDTHVASPE